jgi:MFS family permease
MGVVAVMLVLSAVVDGHIVLFLLTLAMTGVGLGAFTPPNNASIMRSVAPHKAGMASGALNMTRGIGTSLGLALGGLAYTVGAGSGLSTPPQALAGYRDAALFLAAAAVLAAVVSGLRGTGDPGRVRAPSVRG